jgi:hypothetical protein
VCVLGDSWVLRIGSFIRDCVEAGGVDHVVRHTMTELLDSFLYIEKKSIR